MDTIESRKFKFTVGNSLEDAYTKVGISEQFGFGFMQRDSGYVVPLLGPEIYDVKKKYELGDEEMIELYVFNSTTYYPEEVERFTGAFDILHDDTIYTYEKSAETEDGTDVTILKSFQKDNNPTIFETEHLNQMMNSGDATALWPLIQKANR